MLRLDTTILQALWFIRETIEQLVLARRDYGIGVRVIVSGALWFSATSDLSTDLLLETLE